MGILNNVLGIWFGLCVVFCIIGVIVYAGQKVGGFFHKIDQALGTPPSVDVTVNQMYGDVHMGDKDGSEYRKARHPIRAHHTGG